jgi:hypothetical protein
MKERHLCLELAQEQSATSDASRPANPSAAIRAVGWSSAERAAELGLARGSLIDVAYRIR